MGQGINIKKPDRVDTVKSFAMPLEETPSDYMPPLFYVMLGLIFPAAMVALYFFLKTRIA